MATAAKKTAAAKTAPARKRVRVNEPAEAPKGRARVRLDTEDTGEELGASSTYFADVSQKEDLDFISSGAATLDCVLSGGYVVGRVVNIVGDKSAGKTLLAMEALANFHMKHQRGMKRYAESEHAFDKGYADALGIPVDAVEFVDHKREALRTVEDFHRDLKDFCRRTKDKGVPGMYILDSLDALSDDAEMERAIDDKATFGAAKAKLMSELFRKINADVSESNVLLIVVSQLREAIGVMFGEKYKRSGGRALDFYCTHIIWLAEIGKIKQTQSGIERVIGVNVKARAKKNKVGLPFRDCEYPILFGYGVDDLTSSIEWMFEAKREKILEQDFGVSKSGYKVRVANLRNKGGEVAREFRQRLRDVVFREWQAIEQGFLPKSKKY